MAEILNWLKRESENRKFRLLLLVNCILFVCLLCEFIWMSYGICKIIRYLIVLQGLFIIAWIDACSKLIPNKILLSLLGIRIVLLVFEWLFYPELGFSVLISSAAGAVVGGALFLLCYFISRGGLGAGDVKLFAVLGWYVGLSTIMNDILIIVFCSAVYSVAMLILKKKSMKEEIPFAPFILLGTIITLALGM